MGNSSSSTADAAALAPVSLVTVPKFDQEAYKGLWYVVAEIPRPNSSCTYSVSTYFPLTEGNMHVTNYCIIQDHVASVQQGTLATVDKATPGKLDVVQDDTENIHIPYWVYATDYRSYSIVGGGNASSLWILARTRTISGASMSEYIGKAGSLGYDTSRIVIKGRAIQSGQTQLGNVL